MSKNNTRFFVFVVDEMENCFDGCPIFNKYDRTCNLGVSEVSNKEIPSDCKLRVTGISSEWDKKKKE